MRIAIVLVACLGCGPPPDAFGPPVDIVTTTTSTSDGRTLHVFLGLRDSMHTDAVGQGMVTAEVVAGDPGVPLGCAGQIPISRASYHIEEGRVVNMPELAVPLQGNCVRPPTGSPVFVRVTFQPTAGAPLTMLTNAPPILGGDDHTPYEAQLAAQDAARANAGVAAHAEAEAWLRRIAAIAALLPADASAVPACAPGPEAGHFVPGVGGRVIDEPALRAIATALAAGQPPPLTSADALGLDPLGFLRDDAIDRLTMMLRTPGVDAIAPMAELRGDAPFTRVVRVARYDRPLPTGRDGHTELVAAGSFAGTLFVVQNVEARVVCAAPIVLSQSEGRHTFDGRQVTSGTTARELFENEIQNAISRSTPPELVAP